MWNISAPLPPLCPCSDLFPVAVPSAPSCHRLRVTLQFIVVPQALTRGSIRANEAWEEARESEEGRRQTRGFSGRVGRGSVGMASGEKIYITAKRIKKNDTSSRPPHSTQRNRFLFPHMTCDIITSDTLLLLPNLSCTQPICIMCSHSLQAAGRRPKIAHTPSEHGK